LASGSSAFGRLVSRSGAAPTQAAIVTMRATAASRWCETIERDMTVLRETGEGSADSQARALGRSPERTGAPDQIAKINDPIDLIEGITGVERRQQPMEDSQPEVGQTIDGISPTQRRCRQSLVERQRGGLESGPDPSHQRQVAADTELLQHRPRHDELKGS